MFELVNKKYTKKSKRNLFFSQKLQIKVALKKDINISLKWIDKNYDENQFMRLLES